MDPQSLYRYDSSKYSNSSRRSRVSAPGSHKLVVAAVIAVLAGAVNAQVKIGDNPVTINPGSALEVESINRGVLVTRIALTDRNTWALNGNVPVEGMIVYNTTATTGVNGLQAGLAVWKNGRWISVDETPYFHTNSVLDGNSTLANSGATGANSIAVGPNALASTTDSIAMGRGASVNAPNTITPNNDGIGGVAIGQGASVRGGSAAYPNVAIGYGSTAGGATGSGVSATAVGGLASAAGTDSTAIGRSATASGNQATALGMATIASGVASTATGVNSTAASNRASAFGYSADATGNRATAIGADSAAAGDYSVTLGAGATASGLVSLSQGLQSVASGDFSNAQGYQSKATATSAMALGMQATASQDGSVALGSTSVSDRVIAATSGNIPAGSSMIGYNTTDRTLLGAVSVGNATSYRQITNVADGTDAQDAVTIRQLTGALQSFVVTPTKYFHANSAAADSLAVGAESVAVGPQTVVNGNNGVGMGNGAVVQQSAPGGIAIGQGATSLASDAIAMGTQSSAAAAQGVALGAGASVTQAGGVALGAGSVASTAAGVVGYVPPTATAAQRIAIGATTSTLAAASVGDAAQGQFRQITGVAAGAADSDAVNVSQLRAVQGIVSVIDQSTVKYDTNVDGSPNYNSVTMGGNNATGPVAVHNVANGVAPYDAVNVNQLNGAIGGVNNRINALDDKVNANTRMLSGGIAASAAMAVVTPVEPGRYHVSGAVAGYNGQAGVAFNLLKRSDNGQTTTHAGVGWGSGGSKAIVRVGFGFSFD